MHSPLKLAILALPFATASASASNSRLTGINARDSLTDIVTDATDIVGQVNTALGNIIPSPIDSSGLLESTLDNVRQQAFEVEVLEETFAGVLQAVVATTTPNNISAALTQIATLVNGTNSTIENAAQLILNGLSTVDLTQNVLAGYLSGINSFNNDNPPPPTTIYPKKSPQDAPYTVPEAQLRAAIYTPPSFTYGAKRPILFVPGTGAFGGVNFISNLGKLLGNDGRFDPVYLNVPGAMYNDTQINSEYIAYAINYLGSITGTSANTNNLAVIPWSQGNLDTQWVFQYWPSTRPVVTDFISASADFHGTTLAYLLDPALINPPLPPSIIQQEYDSNFVLTLRYGGGGSPYVNSTSVHSITDEIVQPQFSPFASADYFTQDLPGTPNTSPVCPVLQNVPYTNNQIQTVCAGQPAGGPYYTHEGVLYNPLMYALTLDALTHDGPGRIERLDLATVCSQFVAPGLSLADVLATEGLIPLALINLLLYPGKVQNEPAIMQYAIQAKAQCAANSTNTTTPMTNSTTPTAVPTVGLNTTAAATSTATNTTFGHSPGLPTTMKTTMLSTTNSPQTLNTTSSHPTGLPTTINTTLSHSSGASDTTTTTSSQSTDSGATTKTVSSNTTDSSVSMAAGSSQSSGSPTTANATVHTSNTSSTSTAPTTVVVSTHSGTNSTDASNGPTTASSVNSHTGSHSTTTAPGEIVTSRPENNGTGASVIASSSDTVTSRPVVDGHSTFVTLNGTATAKSTHTLGGSGTFGASKSSSKVTSSDSLETKTATSMHSASHGGSITTSSGAVKSTLTHGTSTDNETVTFRTTTTMTITTDCGCNHNATTTASVTSTSNKGWEKW